MHGEGRLGGSVGQAAAFGSGHDPGVMGSSPTSGSLLSGSLLPPLKIRSDPTEESFLGEEIELKNSF